MFAHLWVLLLYGSTLSTSMVPFLIAVYCAYILELLFRLWHQGWVKFWYPMLHSWSATDSLHEKYRVQGNHVETWIAIISLLGLLAFGFMEAVSRTRVGCWHYSSFFRSCTQAHATVLHTVNHGVFFLALPVVRLLFIGPFKAQMFGLLNAIPDFGSLFAMLAVRVQ